MELTEYQRLNLLNQYKILRDLAKIRKDEYDIQYYNNLVKIVAEGYERDYELLTEEIDEEFSKEDCDFVWDTLEMYRAIHDSYYKIKKPTLSKSDIKFDGFDGNNEGRYYSLCRFILFDLKRYEEQTEDGRTDFNSHCRRCEKYRTMLSKWNSLGKSYELSEEEIKSLVL